jgi:transcriptional regulator with XRE-family HTH domain
MALGVSDVREVIERVCARPDVLDACRHRDLGVVVEVLGGHGVTQGQIAGLTGISQGRLSEYKKHKRTPKHKSIFEPFADGLGMPPAARACLDNGPGGREAQERVAGRLTPAATEIGSNPGDHRRRPDDLLASRAGAVERGQRRCNVTPCPDGCCDHASHAHAVF